MRRGEASRGSGRASVGSGAACGGGRVAAALLRAAPRCSARPGPAGGGCLSAEPRRGRCFIGGVAGLPMG